MKGGFHSQVDRKIWKQLQLVEETCKMITIQITHLQKFLKWKILTPREIKNKHNYCQEFFQKCKILHRKKLNFLLFYIRPKIFRVECTPSLALITSGNALILLFGDVQ